MPDWIPHGFAPMAKPKQFKAGVYARAAKHALSYVLQVRVFSLVDYLVD